MKKILLFSILLQSIVAFSQVPQGINYQATARNTSGQAIVNQSVNFRFSLIQTLITNSPVYTETFTATTDDLGHVSLVIGQGTVVTGTFSSINWASGPYFLKVELDSGSGYTTMGTTQLLSVPYALYASNTSTKIVRGITLGGFNPTVAAGSGFSVVHSGSGTYDVTFTTPFNTIPVVTISDYLQQLSNYPNKDSLKLSSLTTSGFRVYTATDGWMVENVGFSFIAVGE